MRVWSLRRGKRKKKKKGEKRLTMSSVKRVLKADPTVRVVRADTAEAIAVATEVFLFNLTQAAHAITQAEGRKTILYRDLCESKLSLSGSGKGWNGILIVILIVCGLQRLWLEIAIPLIF